MSAPRVKVELTLPTRDSIVQYLEAQAAEEASAITQAVTDAVDAFDFVAEVHKVCDAELRKFVQAAAGAFFRELLLSEDAHAVVLRALRERLPADPTAVPFEPLPDVVPVKRAARRKPSPKETPK